MYAPQFVQRVKEQQTVARIASSIESCVAFVKNHSLNQKDLLWLTNCLAKAVKYVGLHRAGWNGAELYLAELAQWLLKTALTENYIYFRILARSGRSVSMYVCVCVMLVCMYVYHVYLGAVIAFGTVTWLTHTHTKQQAVQTKFSCKIAK